MNHGFVCVGESVGFYILVFGIVAVVLCVTSPEIIIENHSEISLGVSRCVQPEMSPTSPLDKASGVFFQS